MTPVQKIRALGTIARPAPAKPVDCASAYPPYALPLTVGWWWVSLKLETDRSRKVSE
jgi:hypothetical protein